MGIDRSRFVTVNRHMEKAHKHHCNPITERLNTIATHGANPLVVWLLLFPIWRTSKELNRLCAKSGGKKNTLRVCVYLVAAQIGDAAAEDGVAARRHRDVGHAFGEFRLKAPASAI